MNNVAGSLLPVVLGPLFAAVVALLFGSLGIAGKSRRLEYFTKRVELLSRLLAAPGIDVLPESGMVKQVLRDELQDVVAYARASTIRSQELAHLHFDDLPVSQRLRPPHSPTVGGRFGIFLFYFYGFGVLFYLGTQPMQLIDQTFDTSPKDAITGAIGCALLAIIGRRWAIASARNHALLSRATIRAVLDRARMRQPMFSLRYRRQLRFLARQRRPSGTRESWSTSRPDANPPGTE